MRITKDPIVTEEMARKARQTFRDRSDYWYYNDRDEDHNLEGIRDTLNTLMPDIRKALFAEFEAEQKAKQNPISKGYLPGGE